MGILAGASGRTYTTLPIDGIRGVPQSFPVIFANRNYLFRLYVNIPADRVTDKTQILDLPIGKVKRDPLSFDAFLVVGVDLDLSDGSRQAIFLRKVVPGLEYEAGSIVIFFPQQRVAIQNLNGQGEFGSQITGGIAPR